MPSVVEVQVIAIVLATSYTSFVIFILYQFHTQYQFEPILP